MAQAAQRLEDRGGKSADAFRTISEVADELDVAQHVLRFWESKFPQVRPLKRGGGRRYYRPEDVETLRSIQNLLYSEGYTIKGAQKLLRQKKSPPMRPAPEPIEAQIEMVEEWPVSEPAASSPGSFDREQIQALRDELVDMHRLLAKTIADED